jgi:hypothetical protein
VRHSVCFQTQNSPVCGDIKHLCLFNAKLKLHQIIVMLSRTKLAKLVRFIASNYSFLLETQCAHFAVC